MLSRLLALVVSIVVGVAVSLASSSAEAQEGSVPPQPSLLLPEVHLVVFPGASQTIVNGINDAGQMVGSYIAGTVEHGFTLTLSGSVFASIDYPGAARTRAVGINNAGDIVGCYTLDPLKLCDSGFLLSGGTFTPIAYPGAVNTDPTGIADTGEIVGGFNDGLGGFIRIGTTYVQLTNPQATSLRAWGINNLLTIAGELRQAPLASRGFVLKDSTFNTITFPGGQEMIARGINAAEQVVGQFLILRGATLKTLSFFLSNGSLRILELPNLSDSTAHIVRGINNANQIVGSTVVNDVVQGYVATFTDPPVITLTTPRFGLLGQCNLDVLVSGAFTHFVQGTTNADFGPEIAVNSTTVLNPNQAMVNVTVDLDATLGTRTVTLTTNGEVASIANGFSVVGDPPALVEAAPSVGRQGQTPVSVLVTGIMTNYLQGTTTASFGPGIIVNSVTVHSATKATVNISIQNSASVGPREVTMTTGGEVISVGAAFSVVAGSPNLTSVAPNVGHRNQSNLAVTLTGEFTHFVSGGATVADFGPGVTVTSLTVQSPTQATAIVAVQAAAVSGPREVRVRTGNELVLLPEAFSVALRPAPSPDFDGDGRTDVTVFRPSSGAWFTVRSYDGAMLGQVWGGSSVDVPVAADYDGDRKADLGIYQQGRWYVLRSTGGTIDGFQWGIDGDIPVPADYDGDGKTDIAVYRPSTGAWFYTRSSASGSVGVNWGAPGDIAVPGDYDADGRADLAVFRPSTGEWYILKSSTGYTETAGYVWGIDGDVPVVADFDGDERVDIAVYRPATGTWYVLKSSSGYTQSDSTVWGTTGDVPVLGDYDGDGKTDITVFRPSSSAWYIKYSNGGNNGYPLFSAFQWGVSGDIAVPKQR
jgi:hypothetical protein